jgi:DNA-binding XRE family transcriptional regulator
MKQRAPMRKKSKPRSSSSKLSPWSARNADIEMGRRIRLRRRETGIPQIELAGRLGLSFQQVQKYEKGTNRVGATSFRIPRLKSGLIFPLHTLYRQRNDETKWGVSVRRLAEQIGILVNVADDFNPLEWFKIKNPDSHGDAAS